MNEPIYLTAKQIQRLRTGKTIKIYRNKETLVVGKKPCSDRSARIKARIAAWKAKLREVEK